MASSSSPPTQPASVADAGTEDPAVFPFGHDRLVARFGPWTVDTPLSNVASSTVTGPYSWWKVAGPAHLSFSDRGLTFATTNTQRVCLTFHEPVTGIDPLGAVRHPGLTVTVAEPQVLAELRERARARRTRAELMDALLTDDSGTQKGGGADEV